MFRVKHALVAALVLASCASLSPAEAAFGDVALSEGSQGPDVAVLQQKLNSLGYWTDVDGVFGTWTEKMVLQFQKDQGIKATGVVGKLSSTRLVNLTGPATIVPVSPKLVSAWDIIATAKQYMGVPYVWGGQSPAGFDCSGFTHYVLLQHGIAIPRVSADQFEAGRPVRWDDLRMGDLVFFTTYKPGPSHVGFYIGNGNFIHASSAGKKVMISSIYESYYDSRFIGARRYF